jgi:hypothetical protein
MEKMHHSAWAARRLMAASFTATLLSVIVYMQVCRWHETRLERAHNRIRSGMDLIDVQRELGPGVRIPEDELTNTHAGPVVRGDLFYRWEDDQGRKIEVDFVDNRVNEKWYWEPSL